MAANAGAGIEGHEAKGLGLGSLDDFPQIDAHPFREKGQLVNQGNVDAAKDVLQQLGHLGRPGRRDDVNVGKELGQQSPGQFGALGREPAHHLGRVLDGKVFVAGVDALRRKGEVEILPRLQPRLFQEREDKLLGGAGIGRALQDDQLAGLQVLRNTPGGLLDVGEVGRLAGVKGRRHADKDGIHLAELAVVGAGRKPPRSNDGSQVGRGHVLDIAPALGEGGDLVRVHVQAENRVTCAGKADGQGQANVAQADDGHPGRMVDDLFHHGAFLRRNVPWTSLPG